MKALATTAAMMATLAGCAPHIDAPRAADIATPDLPSTTTTDTSVEGASEANVRVATARSDAPSAPSTTTEVVPPVTSAPASSPAPVSPPLPARALASDLPPEWVSWRESHDDYTAVNPAGYFGRWQFSQSTWDTTATAAGRPDLVGVRPDQASPEDQDEMAAALWAGGAGCAAWEAC